MRAFCLLLSAFCLLFFRTRLHPRHRPNPLLRPCRALQDPTRLLPDPYRIPHTKRVPLYLCPYLRGHPHRIRDMFQSALSYPPQESFANEMSPISSGDCILIFKIGTDNLTSLAAFCNTLFHNLRSRKTSNMKKTSLAGQGKFIFVLSYSAVIVNCGFP